MIFYITALIVTILLMAFFCGNEIGLVSCQKSRIATLVKNGNKRAAIVQYVLNRPALMLATTLVGTNICTVCASVLAKQAALEAGIPEASCVWMVTSLLPVFLLFPEIIPKNWFRQAPAKHCVFFAPLLICMLVILYPVSKLIALITGFSIKLLDKERRGQQTAWLMRDDFRFLIRDSENAGVIDSEAADILDNSLRFHRLRVKDVLTPIKEVIHVTATATIREAAARCREHGVSLLPVKSKRGEWIGIFSIYDAIFSTNEKTWNKLTVAAGMQDLFFLNADQPLPEVITTAQNSNCRMLMVRDEKGEVVGIVTPHDVSDELFMS
ncbi:MAG: CNNM domain-containing protein [Victivallaceae bacterium]|nr:CNNM domain-containing protein [Victivallaceae bacterium]